MGMRERQRGLSMLGFLFVAAVVIVVALVGFRMVPAYIEFYSVQKALRGGDGGHQRPVHSRRFAVLSSGVWAPTTSTRCSASDVPVRQERATRTPPN